MSTTITNSDKVAPYLVRNASSMADWILRCAMMHPSGEQLRKDALCNIVPATDNGSMWDIKVINVKVGKPSASECVKAELSPAPIEAAPQATISLDQLKSRFDAVYKYEKYVNAPVKAAVSTLSHQIDSGDSIIMSHPGFLLNHKLTPAQKGTAMHTFMQFADYKAAKNNMQEELSRLLHSGYMTKIQIESLDTLRLADCLKSSTMERFFHAEETFREYRFTVRANADIIDDIDKLEFDEKDNTIIIQGAVDCAFIENGEIVIIDYKTDKVKNVAELAQRYKSQLKLYKYAMEQTTGKRVKECIIFSLSLNETVNV